MPWGSHGSLRGREGPLRHPSVHSPIGNYPKTGKQKPSRGEWTENQTPNLAKSLRTMESLSVICRFNSRMVRRDVFRPVSSNLIVARISAAEQAFPALILAAHLRASAMVVTLTMVKHLKQRELRIAQGLHRSMHRPERGSPTFGRYRKEDRCCWPLGFEQSSSV